METDLTKRIKARIPQWRPALNTQKRTVRYAYEVWTPTGIVDVIRFEDYISRDYSYCRKITPKPIDKKDIILNYDGKCKISGRTFPCKECRGCIYKRNVHQLGILTTCFEVKISKSDFQSENGHNFHGNQNYYVVPADIYGSILPLVPDGIGVIIYYPKSGHMIEKRESSYREISEEQLSSLLYNALKKWVDSCWLEYNYTLNKEVNHANA